MNYLWPRGGECIGQTRQKVKESRRHDGCVDWYGLACWRTLKKAGRIPIRRRGIGMWVSEVPPTAYLDSSYPLFVGLLAIAHFGNAFLSSSI